jgi:hypothetical protein
MDTMFWHSEVTFIFQEKGEKEKHLKYTYLSKWLDKMKQRIKQLEDEIYYRKNVIK